MKASVGISSMNVCMQSYSEASRPYRGGKERSQTGTLHTAFRWTSGDCGPERELPPPAQRDEDRNVNNSVQRLTPLLLYHKTRFMSVCGYNRITLVRWFIIVGQAIANNITFSHLKHQPKQNWPFSSHIGLSSCSVHRWALCSSQRHRCTTLVPGYHMWTQMPLLT